MIDRRAPFGAIPTMLLLAFAALVAAGCGAADTTHRPAGAGARAAHTAFDASFVPADATWLLIVQLDQERLDRLRRAGERTAGWPLVEARVPSRRESIDAVLGRVGLASTGRASLGWLGQEAGAAILPGERPGWIVWAEVRSGRSGAARTAVDDIVRRTSRAGATKVEERDGRILVASSAAALARVHAARDGSDPYTDRREWKELAPERARSTSVVALFGREGGGYLGADSRGIWFTGDSTSHRCEDYPSGDAFAEIAKRPAGRSIQRASSDGATMDASQLVADRAFVRELVGQLLVASRAETSSPFRSGIEGLQGMVDMIDLARPAPRDGIRMTEDPAYASALAGLGDVPDDAGVVYWIDAGRLLREIVARLEADGVLGSTEAALAGGAANGVDGVLLWVHASGGRDCLTRLELRVSIPSE